MKLPLPFPLPTPNPTLKKRLYITIASLILLTFVLIIARIADKGTPSTRTNTWGIAVVRLPPLSFPLVPQPYHHSHWQQKPSTSQC